MNIIIQYPEMSISGGDIQVAEKRARMMMEIAGAVDVVAYYECAANWSIKLLFEWQGYRQEVRYRDLSYNWRQKRPMTTEDVIHDIQSMRYHAIHLIHLYQIPEDFDRWQTEGGR